MTGDEEKESTGSPAEAARRRRLRAQVFGDVLPESTSDDRDAEGPGSDGDEWLRRNVPPHHG